MTLQNLKAFEGLDEKVTAAIAGCKGLNQQLCRDFNFMDNTLQKALEGVLRAQVAVVTRGQDS